MCPLQGLPAQLLPYLRLAHAESEVEIACCAQGVRDLKQAKPLSQSNEREALHQLAQYLQMRLGRSAVSPVLDWLALILP